MNRCVLSPWPRILHADYARLMQLGWPRLMSTQIIHSGYE
jgi:hypothetical protein